MNEKKNETKVSELLMAEKAKLAKLETKKADIEAKIKVCKENIQKYSVLDNSEKLMMLTDTLGQKGIAFEDVMAAVVSGDFTALQVKMDNADAK